MNPKIKERWLEALRNGDYEQGKRRLKQGDNYCCLGVLCDILKDEVGGKWVNNRFEVEDKIRFGCLPDKVVNYCQLDYKLPLVKIDNNEISLSELNDTGYTFNEIADIIEEQL